MRVTVNGELRETDATTLAALLDAEGLGQATVATAVNGTFVPAPRRGETALAPGDMVEVLAPMQGG